MTRLIYWGHQKCASTWLTKILHTIAWRAGWRSGKHETWKDRDHSRLDGLLASKDVIIGPNARPRDPERAEGIPGFHVIRDPRDLLVSAYFSHRNTHPTDGWPRLAAQRANLQALTKEEGIISTMDFLRRTMESLRDWRYDQPNILELKMEDITKCPYQTLLDVFDYHGLLHDPVEPNPLQPIRDRIRARLQGLELYPARWLLQDVHRHRYKKLSGGRKPGETSQKSHYRKGTPGDWRNHWSDEVQSAYHQRFGRMHEALGYHDEW